MSRTLTPSDRAIIAKIQAAADRRRAVVPPTPEDEADAEIIAFMAMRKIHKLGGVRLDGKAVGPVRTVPVATFDYPQRTPEQQAEHGRTIMRDARTLARAVSGLSFTMGRKVGTKGPIRKAIARLLKKHPDMKNPELWDAIAAKPPKDWEFVNNSQGRYAEGPPIKTGERYSTLSYGRFCTVCGVERKISAAVSAHEARRQGCVSRKTPVLRQGPYPFLPDRPRGRRRS